MRVALFLIMVLQMSATHAQGRRCEIDGVEVNPSNGYTTAGKTGLMICYRADGSKWYEQQIVDGEHLGLDRHYDEDGSIRERTVNAQGNTQGFARDFHPNGQLSREGAYDNGRLVALHKRFDKDGRVISLNVYGEGNSRSLVTIEYHLDGRLRRLQCAPHSMLEQDREICGHAGKDVAVELFDQRGNLTEKRQMREGVMLRSERFDNSERRSLIEYSAEGRVERGFHAGGQIATERVIAGGFIIEVNEWYLNGAIKSRMRNEPITKDGKRVFEAFSDVGVIERREHYVGADLERIEGFDASGRAEEEWLYAPQGHVRLYRKFGATGSVVLEEERYRDGSRKLIIGAELSAS